MPQIESQIIRVCTYVECQKRKELVNCKESRKKRDEANNAIKNLVQKLSSKCFHKPNNECNKKYNEKTKMYTLRYPKTFSEVMK